MLAILNSLNAHNFSIFEPILMMRVSKLMVHKVLSDEKYLSLGLLSPLSFVYHSYHDFVRHAHGLVVFQVHTDFQRQLPNTGLEIIKIENSLKLKIKRNDWLLGDICLQAANHCALF